ncbi:MAG: alkaline phosphatase family protein [Solirubrobacteraceae bacterium]
MPASVDRAGLCEDCGSPRQRGQRYCLGCGGRIGSRSPQLEQLLGRVRAQGQDGGSASIGDAGIADGAGSSGTAPAAGARRAARRPRLMLPSLPSSRVSAVLVMMFLGFGVIVGDVAGSSARGTSAASSARHVKLVLPAAAPVAATSTPESSSSGSGEPPSAASEPTPSAGSESTPSAGASPTPTSSGNKSGSGKSSSPSPSSSGGGGNSGSSAPAPGGSSSKLPPIKHVFVIMLSDQPYASVFGPSSQSPYLSQTLEHKGELLVRYYAVAHQGLADAIALISGQGPTVETAANCPTYSDIAPGTVGADEQVTGSGCVYPSSTRTLAGQLAAKHMPWRAYVEGMGERPGAESGGADGDCGHPALGSADPTSAATPPAGQTYATYRNPFVYFSSLIGAPACEADDVGINQLSADLATPSRTPSFAYIAPDLCHDASPTPCAPGAPAGLPAAEGFLKKVVPEITGSRAYRESGLLVITVDQAPSTGEFADSSSCCGQPRFPNLPASTSGLSPEGGGQVGALLLSPFIKQGVSQEQYNHFSLLRTIEDLFGLPHLGYAGLSKVSSFAPSLLSARQSG